MRAYSDGSTGSVPRPERVIYSCARELDGPAGPDALDRTHEERGEQELEGGLARDHVAVEPDRGRHHRRRGQALEREEQARPCVVEAGEGEPTSIASPAANRIDAAPTWSQSRMGSSLNGVSGIGTISTSTVAAESLTFLETTA